MANTNPEKIGRYQILERVGRGGMGVLYRGIDPVLDREVAIKVMLVDFSEDTEQMRPRFYREAQAAAKLQHSNIVTVFEFAEDNNTPYIVMEFLRGEPLQSRMASPIPLTLDDKLNVVAQLCGALHYAHEQGVVHRDIKPANIFLLADGTVKLLDFGVAKLTTSTLTRQGDVLGSASYMSPEQVGGSDTVDGRSDIFSVGVMLYEMLAGKKPFQGENPTATIMKILRDDPPPLEEAAPGLPTALVDLVSRTLAKDPAGRFSTAGELARELQRIRLSVQAGAAGGATPGLDETRFASPSQILALQKELAKDAKNAPAAEPSGVTTAPGRPKWLVPVGLGVAALVVVALAATMFNRPAQGGTGSEAGAKPAANAGAKTPEAAPAALEKTVLQIESTPPGAALVIDGQPTSQQTPVSITLAGPGPHTLKLSKRGFASQDVTLTASDLKRGSVSYTLTASEVTKTAVTIDSAYPVEVLTGSKVVSPAKATHQLSVPSGTKLRVTAREYLLDAAVNATGKSVEYHAPPIGRLTVLTKYETCNIKIGEHVLGFPPISRLPIASGQYRVDIACPNGQNPAGQFVTIGPNESQTVRIY